MRSLLNDLEERPGATQYRIKTYEQQQRFVQQRQLDKKLVTINFCKTKLWPDLEVLQEQVDQSETAVEQLQDK